MAGVVDYIVAVGEIGFDGVAERNVHLGGVDNGLIVEHWDVMEEILPEAQWVNAGKF